MALSRINTNQIVDGAVATADIADGLITTAKLADGAVTTAKITDGNISTAKLADDAVTNAKVADNAVANAQLADNAVGTSEIADDAVTTAKVNPAQTDITSLGTLTALTVANNATLSASNPQLFLSATADGGEGSVNFKDDEGNIDGKIAYRTDYAGNTDNFMTFNTGGSERMRIDDNGRVGIGVTDPTQYNSYGNGLVIEKTSASGSSGMSLISATNGYGSIYFNDGTGNNTIGRIEYFHGGDVMGFVTAGTERFKIDADGFFTHTANHNGDLTGTFVNIHTNPYGVASAFTGSSPDNNTNWFFNANDTTAQRFRVQSDGDVVNHDNSYGAMSDERIKQDIVDANSQWDDIKAIKVRNFKKKDDVAQYGDKAWQQIGVIAQELEKVCPKLIKESAPSASDIKHCSEFGTLYEDGDDIPEKRKVGDVKEIKSNVKKVSYSILYMKAVKALQEAMTRIETLETSNADLIKRIETLEGA